MGFYARLNFPAREPAVRAYLHEAGLREAYGNEDPMNEARTDLLEILDMGKIRTCFGEIDFSEYQFILAVLWGYNGDEIFDFCGMSDIGEDNWPGNADMSFWVLRNGVYVPDSESLKKTCGHGITAFGKEEEYRTNTQNLEIYKLKWPHLGKLEPKKLLQVI